MSLYYCLEEKYEKETKFVYNDVKNITKESVELHNFYRSGLKSYGINAGATIGYGIKYRLLEMVEAFQSAEATRIQLKRFMQMETSVM